MGVELSHVVARCLSKPREFSDKIQKRALWFYDFQTDSISRKSSRALFAEQGVFSAQLEDFLDRYIETPLSQTRDELLADPKSEIKNWKCYRALWLLFATQPLRYNQGKIDKAEQQLEKFSDWPESQIDTLVQIMNRDKHVVKVLSPKDYIYFPEAGFFSLPVPLPGGCWEIGFACPFTPHAFLVLCSKRSLQATMNTFSYSRFSIGISKYCRRVLIPPKAKKEFSNAILCKEIKRERITAMKLFRELGFSLRKDAM